MFILRNLAAFILNSNLNHLYIFEVKVENIKKKIIEKFILSAISIFWRKANLEGDVGENMFTHTIFNCFYTYL